MNVYNDTVEGPEPRPALINRAGAQTTNSGTRFTRDGSTALEAHLADLCNQILAGVHEVVPMTRLEALVLGGGYGRGEGGVLRTSSGDRPYNDLELYVFLRGNRLLNELKFGHRLHRLAQQLTLDSGLDTELKVDSLAELSRRPVSMFSYDLVARHRILFGGDQAFQACQQHLRPEHIPAAEATRLLMNRCSGLLLVKDMVQRRQTRGRANNSSAQPPNLSAEETDFIRRNLAKLQLGLGDAVLAATGEYHWSCVERHARVQAKTVVSFPGWGKVQELHAKGVEFKLHPYESREPLSVLLKDCTELSLLAEQVWLWLETRRLNHTFASPRDYALSPAPKMAENTGWRNLLLNLKWVGRRSVGSDSLRYPRERLLNSLPLLLWDTENCRELESLRHLRQQLGTRGTEWTDFVSAYRRIWPRFG